MKEGNELAKKKIFISFDYENDLHYKNLLLAWDANKEFDFAFNDKTAKEIQSDDVSRIKAGLTTYITKTDYVLCIVGKYANKKDKRSKEIGKDNWINWEIAKGKELKKKLIGVKIDREYDSPSELLNSGASWAMSFTFDAIKKAINDA